MVECSKPTLVSCDECYKPFANKAALEKHVATSHIVCECCNKKFDIEGMKKHERTLYAKELANEVGICIKFFNTGECKYKFCKYSHDIEAHEEGRKMNGACYYFFHKGYCSNGITCRKSHDEEWLLKKQKDNGICLKIAYGKKCEFGLACFRSHDLEGHFKR